MSTAQLFRPIDTASAYQRVADAIEREIINGRIRPGDPIGTEHDLVRQFGANRSTISQGIRVLEESGLIQRDSGRRLHGLRPAARQASPVATFLTRLTLWMAAAIEPFGRKDGDRRDHARHGAAR